MLTTTDPPDGLIAAGPRLALGLFVGAVAAAVVYNALFVWLSTATSRRSSPDWATW